MNTTITHGLPDGWTFHTIEWADQVTYEVRNEHGFLVMSGTWNQLTFPRRTYGHKESRT